MTLDCKAYRADRIFDGDRVLPDHAVVVSGEQIVSVQPVAELDTATPVEYLGDILLSPGFVDLQVNGGGGIMLGDAQCVDDVAQICAAHISLGTTALLPTLITDAPDNTQRVAEIGAAAWKAQVPGFHGLHMEGPHLSAARKGAHDAQLIRPMTDEDLEIYAAVASDLPNLLVTVAPETVPVETITKLVSSGAIVSLGHSGASYDVAISAAGAGATSVTHLFNAMSPLQHRDPGMVGAALNCGSLHVGLIADGVHVDPAAIQLAMRAKQGPGRIYLVTDAMSVAGTEKTRFELGGRTIFRMNGRLTLEDGTMAGADVDFSSSLRVMVNQVGVSLEEALRMATRYPSEVIGRSNQVGTLQAGARSDFIALDNDFGVKAVWLGGTKVH